MPKIVSAKLQKESALGRLAGPFDSPPPFDEFAVIPAGLVPIKNPDEFRTIHHLSYPTGLSVSDGISRENATPK